MDISNELRDRILKLSEKYKASGQELLDFLDGLLYADYITYWDYIHLDTLLSLQTPKTQLPDEEIFIMYHQITELHFKLCLHEMNQIANREDLNAALLTDKLGRINRYFEVLTRSFGVMVDGMERDQFLHFRMALIPASGFQSVQYRKIEIACTPFLNLVRHDYRDKYSESTDPAEMYRYIYWKDGATIEETGEKTLTLRQFEAKYSEDLIKMGREMQAKNIWARYTALPAADQKEPGLIKQLRMLDLNVNVNWPLEHYKSAVRYLAKRSGDVRATGGTNWQKYLPPRYQKRIFYPQLWTEQEREEWGKNWVSNTIEELKSGS